MTILKFIRYESLVKRCKMTPIFSQFHNVKL